MHKHLIGALSALALMTGPALAAGMSSPAPSSSATTGTTGSSGTSGTATGGTSGTTAPVNPAGGMTLQSASASNLESLLGDTVVGANGQKVGSVDDIILDPSTHQPTQLVIASGGFLGIGEKKIAVDASQVTLPGQGQAQGQNADENAKQLHVAGLTEDQIKSMPEFKYDQSMTSLAHKNGSSGSGTTTTPANPAAPMTPNSTAPQQ